MSIKSVDELRSDLASLENDLKALQGALKNIQGQKKSAQTPDTRQKCRLEAKELERSIRDMKSKRRAVKTQIYQLLAT